jgi:hypothetical protein
MRHVEIPFVSAWHQAAWAGGLDLAEGWSGPMAGSRAGKPAEEQTRSRGNRRSIRLADVELEG